MQLSLCLRAAGGLKAAHSRAASAAPSPQIKHAASSVKHAAVAQQHTSSDTTITERKRQALKGARKQALRLFLGCLPLIEQRFRVGRGMSGSMRKQTGQGGKQDSAPSPDQHPQEFVLVAPGDVDQVIDLYFER